MRARPSFLRLLVLTLAGAGLVAAGAGCRKKAPADPAFDQRWASLAQKGSQAFYIEDDRGEGLMGNVLRAQEGALAMAPALAQSYKGGGANLPDQPNPDEVQKIIRQYLPGVKSCYLRLARGGDGRSGKAIVSFQIAGDGKVQGLNVDAPAFQGTTLPTCISGQITHWAFPPSRKGMDAISYPFVFVGS